MIHYAYYNNTGRYVQTGTAVSEVSEYDIPGGCYVYYGQVDISSQYHNLATDSPADKGPAPGEGYEFDYTTKTWKPNVAYLFHTVKDRRNQLLTESDWTQLPRSPLTTEQQDAWAAYRQELRDIPQQAGFPLTVVWPTPPA
jgi:hypothetical protein